MLDKANKFYTAHRYVILWTIWYFVAVWAIMRYLFNFDIFSVVRWWQLLHSHLHGFAGFVFGILILATIPMYVATSIVIAKTKSPLFKITVPNFIKQAFIQTAMQELNPTPETKPIVQETEDTPHVQKDEISTIPNDVPREMRVAYLNARRHVSRAQMSNFSLSNATDQMRTPPRPQPQPVLAPTEPINDEMPIPTDFDIEDTNTVIDTIPQFTDINFDDDTDTIDINDIKSVSETTAPVTEYLDSKNVPYSVDGDVVLTDKFAIVAHTDSEFWVADPDAWFAAGKTRPSPIESVKQVAAEHDVQPVLYLGADNIMDIDELCAQWGGDGIRIIHDLKDLK